MRCFFSLSSTSVAAPTLMTATPPASLARRSWSFSRSQSESVLSISALIWLMRPSTSAWLGAGHPSTIVVSSLVMMTRLAVTEQVEGDVLELETDLLADDLTTGEDGHVLQHRLAALTEAGRLHRDGVEGAADLVDHEGGESLALDVLGDDHERLAGLHDGLEHRQHRLDGRDLALVEQDVGILEHRLLAIGIGDEVGRQVALVELHALGELELGAERVRLLDGDHAVLADLVDGVGDDLADRRSSAAEMVATLAISLLVVDLLGLGSPIDSTAGGDGPRCPS